LINVTLLGYKPIIHADSKTKAGGVGVYVADYYALKFLEKIILIQIAKVSGYKLQIITLKQPKLWELFIIIQGVILKNLFPLLTQN